MRAPRAHLVAARLLLVGPFRRVVCPRARRLRRLARDAFRTVALALFCHVGVALKIFSVVFRTQKDFEALREIQAARCSQTKNKNELFNKLLIQTPMEEL